MQRDLESKVGLLEVDNGNTASDGGTPSKSKKDDSFGGKDTMKAIVSSLAYAICTVSMVLSNKAISAYNSAEIRERIPPFFVVFYQSIFAVVFLEVLKKFKCIEYEDFSKRDAIAVLPLSILFVGMIVSGFMAISYINVPLMTVFKNMTNLVTMSAEWYLFNEQITSLMVVALIIMAVGATFAATNDVEFNLVGYIWMGVNCFLTAAYVLYMRYASDYIIMTRFGMVFYNNLLSLVFLIPLMFVFNEIPAILDEDVVMNLKFFTSNTLAGLFGVSLNFASLWCVACNSGTTYSVVGTVSKIPIIILGAFMFKTNITVPTIGFILCGTVGGFLYAVAKMRRK